MSDVLSERGHLFLGSRLKRLGERLQADVLRILAEADLPIVPSQSPIMAALDRDGPSSIGDLVRVTGVSQPAVTRSVGNLLELGLVEARRAGRDQRQKTVSLTPAGEEVLRRSKEVVWPRVEAAVVELCAGIAPGLLAQLDGIEAALARLPLDRRGLAAGLELVPFSDELASAFHDINKQWIEAMFSLEPTDLDVLRNPRARIIEPGGDIQFVRAPGLGIVGACALQKTGPGQFELTKMGVLESARGRKAGEFLLQAMIRRAGELGAERLYLLTNSACGPAIHLYEKLGFVHDGGIMAEFGGRYKRADVAMRYAGNL